MKRTHAIEEDSTRKYEASIGEPETFDADGTLRDRKQSSNMRGSQQLDQEAL